MTGVRRPATTDASQGSYRRSSFWFDDLVISGRDDLAPRAPLTADARFDVCVVGGGLTGLWTAFALAKADPELRIAVLEREIAGFGASGRNGGWCSALFPRSAASLEREHGFDAAVAMRRAMIDTVGEVGRVAAAEGIDCDFARGGTVVFARTAVQRRAARADVEDARQFDVDRLEYWDGRAVAARFGVTGLDDGEPEATFDPACARVHPAKLVRGLANVVESLGVTVFERTEVVDWSAGRVRFRGVDGDDEGTVHARHVIIALEGYGSQLPRVRRRILPLYSLMIATEPLGDDVWDEIGIEHGQTFSDYRHLLVYGQRTADNRFAFGGRGPGITGAAASTPRSNASTACSSTCGRRSATSSRPQRTRASRTAGAARWAWPAIGTPPRATTRRRASASPAATSATGCRPRTSPDGRWPTSCSAGIPSSHGCPGRITAHRSGNPSRCGSPGRTSASSACSWPISRSTSRTAHRWPPG